MNLGAIDKRLIALVFALGTLLGVAAWRRDVRRTQEAALWAAATDPLN